MSIAGGHKQGNFRPFNEARAFARSLKLRSSAEWVKFCASGRRPSDIPSNPQAKYDVEWQGWRDWLGTGETRNARSTRYKFRSFEEARRFAHELGLTSLGEWRLYCASPQRQLDIPTNPQVAYRSQWMGWGDWLGTGNTKNSFLPFAEARCITRGLGLKSMAAYYAAARLPQGLPKDPHAAYRQSGWQIWSDWLGNSRPSTHERKDKRRPFTEAADFAKSLGLRSKTDWFRWVKSGDRPDDIPANPADSYEGDGWQGWAHFLGTTNKRREMSSIVILSTPESGLGPKAFNHRKNGKRSRSRANCPQIFLPAPATCTAIKAGSRLAIGWARVSAIRRTSSGAHF